MEDSIAILGGTGDQGLGLALRFAAAGRPVVIGSRKTERAVQAADEVREAVGEGVLAEWMRNALRQALSKPLSRGAGYAEGHSAGWAEANRKFREALKRSG